jgi:hypothetical protein
MNLKDLSTKLKYESAWGGWDDRDVTGAFSSDLLSDVMAHSDEGQLLITIQAHKNTVAVAVLKDLAGLVIASNRPIPEDMIEAARDEGIPIFVTGDNQYEAGWRLHELGGF